MGYRLYLGSTATGPTSTSVARLSLAGSADPGDNTNHAILVRARVTSGAGTATLRAALYEGANNRSGDLETAALTTSLADYSLAISEANAANITSYTDLELRVWGYDSGGAALTFEVDYIALQTLEPTDVNVDAEHSAVTVAAYQATTKVATGGTGHAAATMAAYAATSSVKPTAGHSAATIAAYGATVSVKSGAGHAAITVASLDTDPSLKATAGHSAVTMAGYDATASALVITNVAAEHAAATIAAYGTTSKVSPSTSTAGATLEAYGVAPSLGPQAPVASATISAHGPSLKVDAGTIGTDTAAMAAHAASVNVQAGAGHAGIVFLSYDAVADVPVIGTEADAGHASIEFWATVGEYSDLETIEAFVPPLSVSAYRAFVKAASTTGHAGVAMSAYDATVSFAAQVTAGHASITISAEAPAHGVQAEHAFLTGSAGDSTKSLMTDAGQASAQFALAAYDAGVSGSPHTLAHAEEATVTFSSTTMFVNVDTNAGLADITVSSFDITTPAVAAELDVDLYNTMTLDVELSIDVTLDVRVY